MTSCTKYLYSSQHSAPRNVSIAVPSVLMVLLPSVAQAHSGHIHSTAGHAASFLEMLQVGLMHPVTGLDHLFLAVGMGMLFYGLQKQRLGMMSLTAGLSLGAILGTAGVLLGGIGFAASSGVIEVAISLSVVVLALVLMSQKSRHKMASAPSLSQSLSTRPSRVQRLSLIGFGGLAVFHGMAHAMEVPVNAGVSGQLGFYTGMMMTMLALYSIGMLLSQQLQQRLGGSLWLQRVLVVLGLGAVFVPVLV